MNYYVVHATSNVFVRSTGASNVYTAFIIGAPNITSLIATIFHLYLLTRRSSSHDIKQNFASFRRLFILSSFWGIAGNAIHATAIDIESIPLAVGGRLIFGLSSAEILQRQVLTACVPSHVVHASARLQMAQLSGMFVGLLVGAFAEAMHLTLENWGVRSLQSTSWLLMIFWMCHFVRLLFQFKAPGVDGAAKDDPEVEESTAAIVASFSDGSSTESDTRHPSSVFRPSLHGDGEVQADLSATYGTIASGDSKNESFHGPTSPGTGEATPLRRNHTNERGGKKRGVRQFRAFASRIRKLLAYHVGIPVSFFILTFATFSVEVFFTGTPIITQHYFDWSGAHACLFLGGLALSTIPIHFFCERIARRYEERTVIKVNLSSSTWATCLSRLLRFPCLSTGFTPTGGSRTVCNVQLGLCILARVSLPVTIV